MTNPSNVRLTLTCNDESKVRVIESAWFGFRVWHCFPDGVQFDWERTSSLQEARKAAFLLFEIWQSRLSEEAKERALRAAYRVSA